LRSGRIGRFFTEPSRDRHAVAPCVGKARSMQPAAAVPVCVEADGPSLVLRVGTVLDAATGLALLDAARAAVTSGTERVDIDLCNLLSFTSEGAAALVVCREVCGDLPEGLHYRTGKGPGREALLEAYADHASADPVA
jgi:hypothetical protein